MEGLQKVVENSVEQNSERIRISVANLVQSIRVEGSDKRYYLGILNPTDWKKGKRKFQPLGGGAEVTETAKKKLEDLGAIFTEGNDARFTIPKNQFSDVYAQFSVEDNELFERDVVRELREELCEQELVNMPAVLSEEDVDEISVSYSGVVSQLPVEQNADTVAKKSEFPSRRLFHLYELVVPQEIFEKMKQSESLHFYSPEEIESINSSGVAKHIETKEGATIANNVIITDFPIEH